MYYDVQCTRFNLLELYCILVIKNIPLSDLINYYYYLSRTFKYLRSQLPVRSKFKEKSLD